MMDAAARQRLLMSLRSERAMGLRSVPAAELPVPEVEPEPMPIARPVSPRPVAPPPRTTTAPAVKPPAARLPATPVGGTTMLFGTGGGPTITDPVLSTDDKRLRLSTLDVTQVRVCVKCRLCETRTQTVFGEGDVDASIFFVGEGPGENEDLTGRPFVGKAGQLLDKMIAGMGIGRGQVYIGKLRQVPAAGQPGAGPGRGGDV